MTVRSLGYRTDLFFIAFDGEVVDRGRYVVARSPANPTYYWGNFLLFDHVPDREEVIEWRALFAAEFGDCPEVRHVTLGIAAPEDELARMVKSPEPELELSFGDVLVARTPCPAAVRHCPVEIRAVCEDWEWERAIENQVECRDAVHEEAGYRVFKVRQMARYRRMVEAGLGRWFGAFVGERLVGDLGLFGRDGIARFQAVGVQPNFRRRGICRALLAHASRYGLGEHGAKALVIVAESGSHARALYESAGFAPTERQVGLCAWPRDEG